MEELGGEAGRDGRIRDIEKGVVASDVSGSIIAGRDVNQIIHGVDPGEHARALAQIEILREKLGHLQCCQ